MKSTKKNSPSIPLALSSSLLFNLTNTSEITLSTTTMTTTVTASKCSSSPLLFGLNLPIRPSLINYDLKLQQSPKQQEEKQLPKLQCEQQQKNQQEQLEEKKKYLNQNKKNRSYSILESTQLSVFLVRKLSKAFFSSQLNGNNDKISKSYFFLNYNLSII